MIEYQYKEEKLVALFLADLLNDKQAMDILEKGYVSSKKEAQHLSEFFWRMIDKSAEGVANLPCEGSAQYWTEKLYNSIGAYLENAGYAKEWNDEINND